MPNRLKPRRQNLFNVLLLLAWGPLGAWPAYPQPKSPTALAPQKTLSPTPSFIQLRNSYLSQCDMGPPDDNRTRFCTCSFNRIVQRYTAEQYILMDQLIRSGGPAVAQFARTAWAPEFVACRNASPK
jgi:hypothetical protein